MTRQVKLHRKFHIVPKPEPVVRNRQRARLKREIYEELGVLTEILDSENPPVNLFVSSGASAHDRKPQLSKRA